MLLCRRGRAAEGPISGPRLTSHKSESHIRVRVAYPSYTAYPSRISESHIRVARRRWQEVSLAGRAAEGPISDANEARVRGLRLPPFPPPRSPDVRVIYPSIYPSHMSESGIGSDSRVGYPLSRNQCRRLVRGRWIPLLKVRGIYIYIEREREK